jgi:hypothetical protein
VAFLLKLLRIFIMAAFSTSKESQVYDVAKLVRKSSSVQEDENFSSSDLIPSEGSRFKELQKLLHGPIGEEIIETIDYKLLQAKILRTIEQILLKKELIFEDKLIIENALSLWVGCVLHKNELFNEFYEFNGVDGSSIRTCDDFILNGLLFCPYDKVREEFKQTLSSLAHKLINREQVRQTPLFYLLKLLSENFSLISSYHCKQYFELFCELVDYYFIQKMLKGDDHQQQAFNPESLLALIIDKIRDYNKLASEQSQSEAQPAEGENNKDSATSEMESIYVGLI